MTTVEITMLGRFAVTVGCVPVAEASWTRRQAAALVKVLALAVAAAEGDHEMARIRLQSAAEQFERAGQPLDARRCRHALAAASPTTAA